MVFEKAAELLERLPEDYIEDDYKAKLQKLGGLAVPLNIFLFQVMLVRGLQSRCGWEGFFALRACMAMYWLAHNIILLRQGLSIPTCAHERYGPAEEESSCACKVLGENRYSNVLSLLGGQWYEGAAKGCALSSTGVRLT